VYFAKPGDTLSGISRLFGVDVDAIREMNRLRSADIAAGARIRIPDKPAKPGRVAEVSRHREVTSDRVLQAVCRDETVYHAVVKGDTLSSIASRYDSELGNLLHLNGLRKSARLAIGQRLLVRRSGPRTHTVVRGETLNRIATRYAIAAAEIVRLNRLDGTKLAAGQRLLIEPCDPYAAAGSAPPPLGGPDPAARAAGGLSAAAAESATQSASGHSSRVLSASAAALAQRVIDLARTMLNVPYRFGGSTLGGIDCSAYVQRVFGLMDVRLPRTAREQFAVGARIGRDDVQVGDLVFFRTYASFPSHVGIYLGENLFIHASSMVRRVAIDSMDLPYYRKRFIGARRLVDDGAPAVASTP
jgi:cell wall-associated NlpC family hydrolase